VPVDSEVDTSALAVWVKGDDVVAAVAVEVAGQRGLAAVAEEVMPLLCRASETGAGGGGDVCVGQWALT